MSPVIKVKKEEKIHDLLLAILLVECSPTGKPLVFRKSGFYGETLPE
jgi:hypothetical protein